MRLARRYGVVENTIYRWKSKYGGMEVSDAKRVRELEQENARLKKLIPPVRVWIALWISMYFLVIVC